MAQAAKSKAAKEKTIIVIDRERFIQTSMKGKRHVRYYKAGLAVLDIVERRKNSGKMIYLSKQDFGMGYSRLLRFFTVRRVQRVLQQGEAAVYLGVGDDEWRKKAYDVHPSG